MKLSRLLAVSSALATAALFVGCEKAYEHDETGLYAKNNQGTNVLGIVDTSPASYKKISATTDVIHSDELYKRKNVSGDNVSVLWGAFTYADY